MSHTPATLDIITLLGHYHDNVSQEPSPEQLLFVKVGSITADSKRFFELFLDKWKIAGVEHVNVKKINFCIRLQSAEITKPGTDKDGENI